MGADVRCPGCEARQAEIEFLRRQVSQLEDRVLATANPLGYQIYKGIPVDQARETTQTGELVETDPQGQAWVWVAGQKVPLKDYQQGLERLEEQMSGRSPDMGAEPEIPL
jgi:hypothetical protein